MSGLVPMIRYRLARYDDGQWIVAWLMGRKWQIVYGPATESDARQYLQILEDQVL